MSGQAAAMVGETNISLEEAFAHARVHGNADFLRDAARAVLIQQSALKLGLKVSDAELQAGADAFRRSKGLNSADETENWLSSNHMSVYDLERAAADVVLETKLRQALTEADIDSYFDEHRSVYDVAACEVLRLSDEAAARDSRTLLESPEGFYAARTKVIRAERDRGRSPQLQVIEGWRGAFPTELREVVFGASPGDVFGPVPTSGGWYVGMVDYLRPATLTAAVADDVSYVLFEAWLDEQQKNISYPALASR